LIELASGSAEAGAKGRKHPGLCVGDGHMR